MRINPSRPTPITSARTLNSIGSRAVPNRGVGAAGSNFQNLLSRPLASTAESRPVVRGQAATTLPRAFAQVTPEAASPSASTNSVSTKAASASTPKYTTFQQNWLDSNSGTYANLLQSSLSRPEPYTFRDVTSNWTNLSNGKPETYTRAVGVVSPGDAAELANLMGGQVVESPFQTIGSGVKDLYIQMPTGQMIDASALAYSLNQARTGSDPFAATQSVLSVYQTEAKSFQYGNATDAIYGILKGTLKTGPQNMPS